MVGDTQSLLEQFRFIMNSSNPIKIYNYMIMTNKQFREFVEENKNKSVIDLVTEYDIDVYD